MYWTLMSENSSKFAVILDGIKLPKEIEKAIESEIKQVVMKYLAMTDLGGGVITMDYVLPRKWLGIPPIVALKNFVSAAEMSDLKAKAQERINSELV